MPNKVTPKISQPGSAVFPNGGGHTDGVMKGSHARGGVLGKPGRSVPNAPALGRLPVQSPTNNLANTKIGQQNPQTAAAATKKPNRKGGAAFYGEI